MGHGLKRCLQKDQLKKKHFSSPRRYTDYSFAMVK
jgi:hypothetical protein